MQSNIFLSAIWYIIKKNVGQDCLDCEKWVLQEVEKVRGIHDIKPKWKVISEAKVFHFDKRFSTDYICSYLE